MSSVRTFGWTSFFEGSEESLPYSSVQDSSSDELFEEFPASAACRVSGLFLSQFLSLQPVLGGVTGMFWVVSKGSGPPAFQLFYRCFRIFLQHLLFRSRVGGGSLTLNQVLLQQSTPKPGHLHHVAFALHSQHSKLLSSSV